MVWLTLMLGATRALTSEEIAEARSVAGAGTPIAAQAFASEEASVAEAVWFVPFIEGSALRARLFAPPQPPSVASDEVDCQAWQRQNGSDEPAAPPRPTVVGTLEFTPSEGERVLVAGVSFADIDEDGLVDVVAMVSSRRGNEAPRSHALIAVSSGQGAYRSAPSLEALADQLGSAMTLKKIVDAVRPAPLQVELSCQRLNVPLAVSEDGTWALVGGELNEPKHIVSLETGKPPGWMNDRLAESLTRVPLGCHWRAEEGVIHGGTAACGDLTQELNDRLAGVQKAPRFVSLEQHGAFMAVGRGDALVLPQAVGEVPAGWAPLPAGCRNGLVRGVLPTRHGAAVFLAPADTVVTPSLYRAPDGAADCICGGGTCIHDIVDEPASKPLVTVLFVKPKPSRAK